MEKIFIQIASYRDPQLLPTLRDCLAKASQPENLQFCIAWQHNPEDLWDNLDEFNKDPRFKILDIPYQNSTGPCKARNLIQQQYDGEKYTLQLDSHHRFEEHWDETLIIMLNLLLQQGISKPALTTYAPYYNEVTDERDRLPTQMVFDLFNPDGTVMFWSMVIEHAEQLTGPIPAKFYSAHFCFTLGSFCTEVPHDPNYYFHGEEISIAARAFTKGYDFFHPHKAILYHEYTREGRVKQWDDDPKWNELNETSLYRNRVLFGMEQGDIDFGAYGLGIERSLADYERFSGLNFASRTYSAAREEVTETDAYKLNFSPDHDFPFMETWVISLKWSVDRRILFDKSMKSLFTYNYFEAYTPDEIEDFAHYFDNSNIYESQEWYKPEAVIACAKSHFHLWKMSKATGKNIFILEDDAEFVNEQAIELLQLLTVPVEFDIFYLDGNRREGSCRIIRPVDFHLTHSYIVSPRGAKILVEEVERNGFKAAVDCHMNWMYTQFAHISAYALSIPIFKQTEIGSDIIRYPS